MTTILVHNAIVHNLPRSGDGAGNDQPFIPKRAVLIVPRTPARELSPQLVATLAEPFLRGTRRIRTDHAGGRPRPGNRQEHHASARRHPHAHPANRRRASASRCNFRRVSLDVERRGSPLHAFLSPPGSRLLRTRGGRPRRRRRGRSPRLPDRGGGRGIRRQNATAASGRPRPNVFVRRHRSQTKPRR